MVKWCHWHKIKVRISFTLHLNKNCQEPHKLPTTDKYGMPIKIRFSGICIVISLYFSKYPNLHSFTFELSEHADLIFGFSGQSLCSSLSQIHSLSKDLMPISCYMFIFCCKHGNKGTTMKAHVSAKRSLHVGN